MLQKRVGVRFGQRIVLAALFLGGISPFAGAQGISGFGGSGGNSGGGLNSTGGGGTGSNSSTGTTGSIGTSTPIGSGPISALTGTNSGLSSLSNTKGASNGTNTVPAPSDPFSSFYVNPYAAGNIGSTTTTAFGQPNYPATTAPTATSTIQTYKASTASGFNTIGTRRAPAYVTGAGEDLPMVRHNPAVLRNELQQIIARSSRLESKNNIRVEILDGAIARLSGTVTSAHDQRLAEGIIRTTPGVQNVVNNLEVVQTR